MKKGLKFGALTLSLALVAGGLVGCKSEGPKVYKVTCEETAAYSISGIDAKGYKAGATVEFTIVPTDAVNYEAKSFTYGDTTVDNLTSNSGSFVMPSKNIVLSAVLRTRKHFVYNANKVRDGMTASFEAVNGDVPITGVTLSVDTPSIPYVIIDGKNITFMEGTSIGKEITIFAKKSSGEIVCQETVAVQRHIKGTIPSDPINAAEAKAVADALPESTKDDKIPTEDYYYIKDVVYKSEGWDTTYNSLTFWLGSNDEFEMYGIKDESHKDDLMIGSEVFVETKIMRFGTTAENYTTKDDTSTIKSLDNSEVRVVKFGWKARTVQVGLDLDPEVSFHPVAAPAPSSVAYSMSKTGVFTESAGIVTGVAKGDATLTATATVGTKQVKGSIHIFVQEGEVKGETPDNPLNAAEAKAIGAKLPISRPNQKVYNPSEIYYYVEDVAYEIVEEYTTQYHNYSAWLGANKDFEAYRSYASEELGAKICKGAVIKLGCYLMNAFGNTIENYSEGDETLAVSNDEVKIVDFESSGLFAGALYVKPEAEISFVVGKAYPEAAAAEKTIHVEILDTEYATYDATAKKIRGVAIGDTKVRISCGTDKFEYDLHVTAEDPKGSQMNPFGVMEVRAYMKSEEFDPNTEFYVTGYVTGFNKDSTNTSLRIYLNDTTTADRDHQFYGYKITNSLGVTVAKNGLVVLKGKLTIYNPQSKPDEKDWTFETNGGGTLVSYTAPSASV